MATDTRLPTGDGALSNWTASSGGSKFSDVDDPVGTPDDDTTYISRSATDGAQTFTFSAFSVPAGSTISRVSVFRRTKRANAGGRNSHPILRVNGTDYTGTSFTEQAAYTDNTVDWTTNPDTSAAWTVDDVNGSGAAPLQEFGLGTTLLGGVEESRCTQIYLEVEYTPPAGGGLDDRRFPRGVLRGVKRGVAV